MWVVAGEIIIETKKQRQEVWTMQRKTFWFLGLSMPFVIVAWLLLGTHVQAAQELEMKAGKPESQFQKAHESFLKKDFKAAASEIRKGAAFLKTEAGHATEDGKKVLMASVHELEKLAGDVEKGTVTSAKDLKDVFARAYHALANNYYLKASEDWAKKEAKDTGQALKAAAVQLEHAMAWSGHKVETGAAEVIKGAHVVAGKLIKGAGWVPEEVGNGIELVGKEVEKFGTYIQPRSATNGEATSDGVL
ncbi:MAG: hypothetical protein D4R73_04150 [Deltaproteobacteria bacterium]|nr:MAG: hypothetical protein D4R73_04150 [Deltaproteobacteria bacterium]